MELTRQENTKEDKMKNVVVMYMNILIRAIFFFFIISLITIMISYFFKIKNPIYSFLFFFFLAILINPLIPNFNIGERLYDKYIKFLSKFIHHG